MAASTGASMVVFTSSKRPAAWHTRLWIGVGQVKLGHPEQAASLTNGGFTADKRRLHCWAQSLKSASQHAGGLECTLVLEAGQYSDQG